MVVVKSHKTALGYFVFSILLLSGCGNESVSLRTAPTENTYDATPYSKTATPDETDQDLLLSELSWSFECLKTAETKTSVDQTLFGGGLHRFNTDPSHQLELNIAGSLCPPHIFERDVVFAIDTSESMRDNYNMGSDPIINGSCGRMNAVKTFLEGLQGNHQTRIGVITYNHDIQVQSDTFISPIEFELDYLNTQTLCAGSGSTNYTKPLQLAETMLNASSRTNARKEVYFISDGLPLSAEQFGTEEAARIREFGSIITLMLKGNDTVLKNEIASHDRNGNLLHGKVENAAALTQLTEELSTIRLEGGLFKYRAIANQEDWVEVEIDADASLDFAIETIGINSTDFPKGIEAKFEYWDNRNSSWMHYGQLIPE